MIGKMLFEYCFICEQDTDTDSENSIHCVHGGPFCKICWEEFHEESECENQEDEIEENNL